MNTSLLFGIPIFKTKINPNSFNKEEIIKSITENYNVNSVRNEFDGISNIHMEYGDRENKRFEKVDYSKVNDVYNDIFKDFFSTHFKSKINFEYEFFNCNYTASIGNQFMAPHNHLPYSDFSCVHYVKLNKKDKPTTFINPSNYKDYFRYLKPNMVNIADLNNINNTYMCDEYMFEVDEDDFIIFPSVIKHKVSNLKSNDIRVTLVTDIILKEQNA
tara:strand:+ start:65 stop:712 length:648 start_codon:yes stop_codon:yes gene_type:complete